MNRIVISIRIMDWHLEVNHSRSILLRRRAGMLRECEVQSMTRSSSIQSLLPSVAKSIVIITLDFIFDADEVMYSVCQDNPCQELAISQDIT